MPYAPGKTEATYDLRPFEAAELALGFARNGGQTVYVTCEMDHERAGDRTIFIGNFPKFANITIIANAVGSIEVEPPMSIGQALALLTDKLAAEDIPRCIIHWRDEPGTFRVATYNKSLIAYLKPAITSWYVREEPTKEATSRRRGSR